MQGPGSPPFDVLLCHYEVALKDKAFLQRYRGCVIHGSHDQLPHRFHWECLIVDEGHRLKNSSSQLYGALREVCDYEAPSL